MMEECEQDTGVGGVNEVATAHPRPIDARSMRMHSSEHAEKLPLSFPFFLLPIALRSIVLTTLT